MYGVLEARCRRADVEAEVYSPGGVEARCRRMYVEGWKYGALEACSRRSDMTVWRSGEAL